MDRNLFEQNLNCISKKNPVLSSRLRSADAAKNLYRFCESRSGEIVPAIIDSSGAAHALHSTVDPVHEAERLISASLNRENAASGILVFLGLGGGFAAEAALKNPELGAVIIIDYCIRGTAELLHNRNYVKILGDPRAYILIDPSPAEIESFITGNFLPALSGAIKVLPLRARTAQNLQNFNAAAAAIERSIEKISADYSVQAHFGIRWFSNIIRNLKAAETANSSDALLAYNIFGRNLQETAICAAGPSLDLHIPLLAERKQKNKELFIFATDTSLPALLRFGLEPDAVVSIDCQHISYYHFTGLSRLSIPLFLDLASPPLLAGLSSRTFFLCGGHPLSRYISMNWLPLPGLDTSGGNVTYACLSLASDLGARRIRVYGADFSYPKGKIYARGTYIYPFFGKKQNRFMPLESLISKFLYRSPFLPPTGKLNYYETAPLRFYRERFEEKANSLNIDISCEPGMGPPLLLEHSGSGQVRLEKDAYTQTGPHKIRVSAEEFLRSYQKSLSNFTLLRIDEWQQSLAPPERQILFTLLPLAAALKYRQPELRGSELIEAAKHYCISRIEKILT